MRAVCLGFLLTVMMMAAAAPPYAGLPEGAVLLEEQPLPIWAHTHRALVLWVWPSEDKPLHWRSAFGEMGSIPEEDSYTCPEQATGHSHFYRTRTRVSLVDTQSRQVLNTQPVQLGVDEFEIPFLLCAGYLYEVPGAGRHGAGKPHILSLKDFNGDGKALEFAFHWMESCTGPRTAVFGYSPRNDRVILYRFLLRDQLSGKMDTDEWRLAFTSRKPISPMHWRYDNWYNSGDDVKYDFRYVPERERFEGTELPTSPETNLRRFEKKK